MFTGLIVGAIAFVVVGVFHPLVIAVEYHLGKRMCWSSLELVWQHERARKGHAKRNPKRPAEYYDGGKS